MLIDTVYVPHNSEITQDSIDQNFLIKLTELACRSSHKRLGEARNNTTHG